MTTRAWCVVAAVLCAASWAVALSQGATGGGMVHVLAVGAVSCAWLQWRLRVAATPFEVWQERQNAPRPQRRRGAR